MKRLDFNKGWEVRCLTTDSAFKSISVPHDAMISEPRIAESLGEGNIGFYAGYDYEYRKAVDVPKEDQGKTQLLEFEGVYHNAEVYINGEKAAERPYGYSNFYVNASDYLRYGENNEILVKACNSDQPNSRWYSGTGIYRPVWLWEAGDAHIPVKGVKIRTLDYVTRRISVTVKTSVPGKVRVKILKGERNDIERTDETIFHLHRLKFLNLLSLLGIEIDCNGGSDKEQSIDHPNPQVAFEE